MSKIKLDKISNWLFYLGLVVGAFGYYRIYRIKVALPPGVCPVNDNRWLLFLGILILLSSVVTAYIGERLNKKYNL